MTAPLRIAVLGAAGTGVERLLARWAEQPDRPANVTLVHLPLLTDAAERLASTSAADASAAPHPALAEPVRTLAHAACDAAWLMGLDTAPATSAATDTWLRALLDAAGLPFQVFYGGDDARMQQTRAAVAAWRAAPKAPHLIATDASADCAGGGFSSQNPQRERWRCVDCGDAACESRLFHDLLAQRDS